MPRLRPTRRVDVIGNLDLKPEEAVGDYIESKQQDAFFVNPPNWDLAGNSVELLFTRCQREYASMLSLQKEMLENAKKQKASNSSRIRDMYALHSDLRKQFIEVNSFIKDCVDKKRIAEKKIADETATQEMEKEKIMQYKASIEELSQFREVLKTTVQELEPYEKVLQEVVDKSDVFVSIQDCMDRCDALMLAQVQISSMEDKKIQEIEDMRKKMLKITNEAAQEVLGLKNDLNELERSYNIAKSECLKWEKILANAKNTVASYDLNKDRALDGIYNMYRMLCKRRNLDPLYQRHEIEKMLDFIKDEMELLYEVKKECSKLMDKKAKTRKIMKTK